MPQGIECRTEVVVEARHRLVAPQAAGIKIGLGCSAPVFHRSKPPALSRQLLVLVTHLLREPGASREAGRRRHGRPLIKRLDTTPSCPYVGGRLPRIRRLGEAGPAHEVLHLAVVPPLGEQPLDDVAPVGRHGLNDMARSTLRGSQPSTTARPSLVCNPLHGVNHSSTQRATEHIILVATTLYNSHSLGPTTTSDERDGHRWTLACGVSRY